MSLRSSLLMLAAFVGLLLAGCDREDVAEAAPTPSTRTVAPPERLDLFGVALGATLDEAKLALPLLSCDEAATRCSAAISGGGELVLGFDTSGLNHAQLVGDAVPHWDHLQERWGVGRRTGGLLKNQQIHRWVDREGSELVLQEAMASRVLSLYRKGRYEEVEHIGRSELRNALAPSLVATKTKGTSIAGVRPGEVRSDLPAGADCFNDFVMSEEVCRMALGDAVPPQIVATLRGGRVFKVELDSRSLRMGGWNKEAVITMVEEIMAEQGIAATGEGDRQDGILVGSEDRRFVPVNDAVEIRYEESTGILSLQQRKQNLPGL